jgi:transposase
VGDHIEVPLAIDDMDVVATEVVNGALEVRVRSTFPAACRHCGSTAVIGHGRNDRRLRDRSCGQPMVLVWHQRRLLCRDCGRTGRELHPAVEGRRSITVRFRRQLFDEACERPFSEVASHHRVSAYRVVEAFDAYSRVETTTVGRPRVLAMDESSFKKRFVFQTVLFDPIAGRGLAVADGRDQRAAEELLFGLVAQRSLRRRLRSPRPGRSRATSRGVGRHQRDRRLLAQPAAAGAKRSSPTSTTARPTVTPKASPTRSKS